MKNEKGEEESIIILHRSPAGKKIGTILWNKEETIWKDYA